MSVALAATIHDPTARLVPEIARSAAVLRDIFAGIALNLTDATPRAVVDAAQALGAKTMIHAQGEAIIGRARRDAVGLALQFPAPAVLYSDFDHVLRWAQGNPAELRATLLAQPQADLLVVGRSARAFAAEPRRLQETERLVNRVYAMICGHEWDLMFAVRRLSRAAAAAVVREAREDSIANDVEWPLLLEAQGFSLGYAAADGLHYRTMEEFGAPADTHDGEPLEWIRRIEIAALHASAMRRFVKRRWSRS
jgi:hypothetical protein